MGSLFQGMRLGSLLGVVIETKPVYLLLAFYYVMSAGSISSIQERFLTLLFVFFIIVAHELGHVLAARHFGFQATKMVLSPLGGAVSINNTGETPRQEIVIALGGPFVNLLFIGLSFLAFSFNLFSGPSLQYSIFFMVLNGYLLLFNLLPAYPMDGGRVFAGVLKLWLPASKAQFWVTRVSQVLTLFGAVYALYYGRMILLAICVFIFIQATAEQARIKLGEILSDSQRIMKRAGFHGGTAEKEKDMSIDVIDGVEIVRGTHG